MCDEVRPGLRVTNYKKRTVIAFEVAEKVRQVSIIGIYYGGQNYKRIFPDIHDDKD
jgi:hypothetical protein